MGKSIYKSGSYGKWKFLYNRKYPINVGMKCFHLNSKYPFETVDEKLKKYCKQFGRDVMIIVDYPNCQNYQFYGQDIMPNKSYLVIEIYFRSMNYEEMIKILDKIDDIIENEKVKETKIC